MILSISIDLTKLDKDKIIEGKRGGKYYNLTVSTFDKPDQYGNDVSVTTQQTKEEWKSKAKKHYVGNGRVLGKKKEDDNSGLPF